MEPAHRRREPEPGSRSPKPAGDSPGQSVRGGLRRRGARRLAVVFLSAPLLLAVGGLCDSAFAAQPPSRPVAATAEQPDPQVVAQAQEALRLVEALRARRAELLTEQLDALRSAEATADPQLRLLHASQAVGLADQAGGLDSAVAQARKTPLAPALQRQLGLVTRGLTAADARDVVEAVRIAQRIPQVSDLSHRTRLTGRVTAAAKALADRRGSYAVRVRATLERLAGMRPGDPRRAREIAQLKQDLQGRQLDLQEFEIKQLDRVLAAMEDLPAAIRRAEMSQKNARFPLSSLPSTARKPVLADEPHPPAEIAREITRLHGTAPGTALAPAAGAVQPAVEPVDKPVDAMVKALQDQGATVTRTDLPSQEVTAPDLRGGNHLNPDSLTVTTQRTILDIRAGRGGHEQLTVDVRDEATTHGMPQDVPTMPSQNQLRPTVFHHPLAGGWFVKSTAGVKVSPSLSPADVTGPVQRTVTIQRRVLSDPAGEFTGPDTHTEVYTVPAKDSIAVGSGKVTVNTGADIQLGWGPDPQHPVVDVTVSVGQDRTLKASVNDAIAKAGSLADVIAALPLSDDAKLNLNVTIGFTPPGMQRKKPFTFQFKGTPQEFAAKLRNLAGLDKAADERRVVDSFLVSPDGQNPPATGTGGTPSGGPANQLPGTSAGQRQVAADTGESSIGMPSGTQVLSPFGESWTIVSPTRVAATGATTVLPGTLADPWTTLESGSEVTLAPGTVIRTGNGALIIITKPTKVTLKRRITVPSGPVRQARPAANTHGQGAAHSTATPRSATTAGQLTQPVSTSTHGKSGHSARHRPSVQAGSPSAAGPQPAQLQVTGQPTPTAPAQQAVAQQVQPVQQTAAPTGTLPTTQQPAQQAAPQAQPAAQQAQQQQQEQLQQAQLAQQQAAQASLQAAAQAQSQQQQQAQQAQQQAQQAAQLVQQQAAAAQATAQATAQAQQAAAQLQMQQQQAEEAAQVTLPPTTVTEEPTPLTNPQNLLPQNAASLQTQPQTEADVAEPPALTGPGLPVLNLGQSITPAMAMSEAVTESLDGEGE